MVVMSELNPITALQNVDEDACSMSLVDRLISEADYCIITRHLEEVHATV